eukprot:scpid56430/ scgid4856/ Dynamin-1
MPQSRSISSFFSVLFNTCPSSSSCLPCCLAYDIGAGRPDRNSSSTPTGRKAKAPDQVIRKGWLTTTSVSVLRGGAKEYWFVLSTSSLAWYRDDTEDDQKYSMRLENVRLRESDAGVLTFSKKFHFTLYNSENKNVYKDHKTLELSADEEDGIEAWKGAFLRAGVFPEREENEETATGDELGCIDPQMERQVEIIRNLLDSYLEIVKKSVRDLVPKTAMHLMILKVKQHIGQDLLPALYSSNAQELMEESKDETRRREETLKMYHACREALQIIGDVSSRTVTTPVPPAVTNSLQVDRPRPTAHGRSPPGSPTTPRRPTGRPSAPHRPTTASRPAPPPPGGPRRPPRPPQ